MTSTNTVSAMSQSFNSGGDPAFQRKGKHVIFRPEYADAFKAWVKSRFEQRRALNETRQGEDKVVFGDERRTIPAWEYYEEAATEEGVPRIICRKCDKVLVHGVMNGTSTMTKHLLSSKCSAEGELQGFSEDVQRRHLAAAGQVCPHIQTHLSPTSAAHSFLAEK